MVWPGGRHHRDAAPSLGMPTASPSGQGQPCWHLYSRPLASRGGRGKSSAAVATNFVVICYGSNRKLIHPDVCLFILFHFFSPCCPCSEEYLRVWVHLHTHEQALNISNGIRSKCGLKNSQHVKWFIVGLFTKYFFQTGKFSHGMRWPISSYY